MALSWVSKFRPAVISQVEEKSPVRQFSIKEPMIFVRSPFEEEIFNEFKKKVSDLELDDVYLLRFLKAREFKIHEAEVMIRNTLKWRRENEIDDLRNWSPPLHLLEDLPFKILDNCDYKGVPMLWLPVGQFKARRWVDAGAEDKAEVTRYGFYIMEQVDQMLKQYPRKQVSLIFDCEGLSFHEAAHIESLQVLYTCCKALEQSYPETMNKIFIINAPWVFTIAFNFIKAIVSKATLAKITVHGHNKNEWLRDLLDHAPEDGLPKQYFEDENAN